MQKRELGRHEPTMTLNEAMARLQKSDSTIRRYVRNNQIAYRKDRQGRYHLSVKDIEDIAYWDRIETPPQNVDASTIAALETRIAELEQEVHAQHELLFQLKAQLDQDRESRAVTMSTPRHSGTKTHAKARQGKDKHAPLPAGWESWHSFLSRHGLKPDRWADVRPNYVMAGEVYQQGSALVRYPLDYAGQDHFVRDYLAQVSECDVEECPCHVLLDEE